MAEPRKSKPRLTLRDLASVEVPSASVNDVLGAVATAASTAVAEATPEETSGTEPAESPSEQTPTATPAQPATSGPVSTRQLQALPEGVSPEVVAMLGLPEASSLVEPEPEPEATPEPVAPEPEPAKSRGGLFAALALLAMGGAVGGWYATRPPVLDASLYETLALEEPEAQTAPIVEVAFLPVPDPIVPEELAAPAAGGTRSDRPRRSVRTDVREEDLF